MSIARSPDRQTDVSWRLGNAKVLARKPSVDVLSQEPGEVDKEADRQERPVQNSDPNRALELATRSISENEWQCCDVFISVVCCTSADNQERTQSRN
jgi:hypothetical protein